MKTLIKRAQPGCLEDPREAELILSGPTGLLPVHGCVSSANVTHSFTRFIWGCFETYSIVLLGAAFCHLLSSSLGKAQLTSGF